MQWPRSHATTLSVTASFLAICARSCPSFIAAWLLLASCATSPVETSDLDALRADGGGGGTFVPEASRPRDTTGTGEVFAHSENTLYRIDTQTRSIEMVGTFEGCTYVADIALDASSRMYASTGAELVLIETNTAHCVRIATGTFPNSLSFVPAGTLDAGSETLVGYQGSDYVKIDPRTGAVTKIGDLGGGFKSSGDVVTSKDGKGFVTVKGKDCADCLAEIDPETGALVRNWGSVGKPDVFGLAFWGGELYAFTNAGEMLLLTLDTGSLQTKAMPLKDAPAKFWGAGSTTSAPTTPVR